jgi:hypothetical protein
MQGYKVYITGESYAGQYIPYLAAGMLDRKDTTYFNLKGIQINDPSINEDNVMIYGRSSLEIPQHLPLTPATSSSGGPRFESLFHCVFPKQYLHERDQQSRRGMRI